MSKILNLCRKLSGRSRIILCVSAVLMIAGIVSSLGFAFYFNSHCDAGMDWTLCTTRVQRGIFEFSVYLVPLAIFLLAYALLAHLLFKRKRKN